MSTQDDFDALVGGLAYPMFVVTAGRGDERSGCLVGFTTQVSIDPPRYLVCLSKKNHTFGVAKDATHLAVHVVPAERVDVAELFGGETGDDVDKFERCDWHDGPHDLPVLDACDRWFTGAVVDRHDLGDHLGLVLEPTHARVGGAASQLSSQRAMAQVDPGHDA
jgi:flavin reductase (DIM6/NTAB) family NADH-FMN oxidoreductase RutF